MASQRIASLARSYSSFRRSKTILTSGLEKWSPCSLSLKGQSHLDTLQPPSPSSSSEKAHFHKSTHQPGGERWKSTHAISVHGHDLSPAPDATGQYSQQNSTRRVDPLDLTFLNHEAAFKSKATWEVVRALLVYHLFSIGPLVQYNEQLMKVGKRLLGKRLFAKLMKMTFYGHFVAGENRAALRPVIHRMHKFGVKSILDYSVEEDLSEDEAVNREMESCSPTASEDLNRMPPVAGNYHDPIKQYHAHEKFGDRRKLVSGARTYFYMNEAQCERNMETFLRCIEAVADSTGGTGMAAVKVTALGRPKLLLHLSEVIVRAHKFFQEVTGKNDVTVHGAHISKDAFEGHLMEDNRLKENKEVKEWLSKMTYDRKGLIHLFSWSGLIDTHLLLQEVFKVPNLETGQMEPLISALTEKEEEQFRNMLDRLNTLLQAAQDLNVRVMIDAEQSYFQPAIHRLAMEMMRKYNTEKAIVFNTYQCYLKNAYKTLVLDLEQANRQNFFMGAKLVRGAYMRQERERAAQLGYEDPINPSFEATSEMYHKCLEECMRRMHELKQTPEEEKRIGIMVASHNADTVRFAIEKMKEYGIKGEERLICFAQLYGMCDNISFPLGQAGYSVYKYCPYGPVNEVLPYLSRRARENKDIADKLDTEKMLLRRELLRRIKSGQIFLKPEGDYVPVGFSSIPALK